MSFGPHITVVLFTCTHPDSEDMLNAHFNLCNDTIYLD